MTRVIILELDVVIYSEKHCFHKWCRNWGWYVRSFLLNFNQSNIVTIGFVTLKHYMRHFTIFQIKYIPIGSYLYLLPDTLVQKSFQIPVWQRNIFFFEYIFYLGGHHHVFEMVDMSMKMISTNVFPVWQRNIFFFEYIFYLGGHHHVFEMVDMSMKMISTNVLS